MATSWAVGAAATLGFVVAGLVSRPFLGRQSLVVTLFLVLLMVATLGVWAYALAMGAYGRRGALLILAGVVLLFGVVQPAWDLATCGETCPFPEERRILDGLTFLVGAASLWALVAEVRERRGPLHVANAVAMVLPGVALLLLMEAIRRVTP